MVDDPDENGSDHEIPTGAVDGDDDLDESQGVRPRYRWELPEVLAGALLIAVAVLFVTGLVGGIVIAFGPGDGGVVPREAILLATAWATFAMLLLLGVLGLVSWQTSGWSEVVDSWPEEGSDSSDTEDLDESLHHLRRAHALASWAGVMSAIVGLTSLARFATIGLNLTQNSPIGPGSWGSYVVEAGEDLATLLLAATAVFAVVQLHSLCDLKLVMTGDDSSSDGR